MSHCSTPSRLSLFRSTLTFSAAAACWPLANGLDSPSIARSTGLAPARVSYVGAAQPMRSGPIPRRVIDVDINTVTEVVRRPSERPGSDWRDGDAWLAGGTWLFSDQQPDLRRLIDLVPLGWDGLVATDEGLEIGAMCTIRDLYGFSPPADWQAAPLFAHQLRGLPGVVQGVEQRDGRRQHLHVAARRADDHDDRCAGGHLHVAGNGRNRTHRRRTSISSPATTRNILAPGELLRRVDIPASALRKRHAHRRFTLTHLGPVDRSS